MALATKLPEDQAEDKNNPAQDEFDKIIERNISPGNKRMMEERAKDGAIDDNTGSSGEDDELSKLEHPNKVGKGYTGEDKSSLSTGALSRRKKWLLAGISTGIVTLIIAALFGFLGIFKLDHIMSNIDAKVYARMQGVEDRRSRRWMQAYLEMRLADIGDSPDLDKGVKSDNQFFRSERVNNGNPIRDWYRTMRTSKFEQEVFEKHGFKFTSVRTAEGKIRPGTIKFNDKTLTTLNISKDEWDLLEKGDTKTVRKFDLAVTDKFFDNDGQARRAIKKMVNEDIPAWRIFLRRHVRKDIQNQIGVRDWRFFEKTRNRIQEKQIDIRNRILAKAIPSSLKSGQILRCLFGVDNCRYSRDSSDPVNQDSGRETNGKGQQKTQSDGKPIDEFETGVEDNGRPILDKDGEPIKKPISKKADPNQITEETAKLAARLGTKIGTSLSVFGTAVNITGTLEILSQVNKAIPQLAKMAVIAKGAQAMGLFQVFETSRDQTKSGELTAAEYNQLMQIMNNPTASEGWNTVIESKSGQPANAPKTKEKYCQDDYIPTDKDFHYVCDDKKIGDASNAEKVQKNYDNSIGLVVGPIVKAYDGAKGLPLLGWLIKKTNNVLNLLGEAVGNVVMGFAKAVGLGNDLKKVLTWIMGKVASFLGAGPIVDGTEQAGELTNWLIQGGAYTAESTARAAGAAVTTAASKAASIVSLNEYRQYQIESSTAYSRTFDLSNPESLAAKSFFGLSNFKLSSVANLLNPKNLLNSLNKPFSANTNAATADDGYRAANFAGLETYDFPPECYNLNPLTAEPLDGTNTLSVFAQNDIVQTKENKEYFDKLATWETQTNSTEFYATVYNIIATSKHKEKADNIAVTIYNCNLLDNRIRGSLGFIYGYTKDNGLEAGVSR